MMKDVIAVDNAGDKHRIGSIHQDGRGYVAWDQHARWLGKSERSRFSNQSQAFVALEGAFGPETGRVVRVSGLVSSN